MSDPDLMATRLQQELVAIRNNTQTPPGVSPESPVSNLFHQVFLHSPEAMAILDLNGQYLVQNSAHGELIGYSDQDLENQTPAVHLGEETFRRVVSALHEAGHFSEIVESRTKDGRRLQVELTAFPIRDEAGRPLCFVGHKRDVTDMVETREQVLRERTALDRIINLNPYGIAVFDAEGRFLRGNQAYLDLFGSYPSPDYTFFSDRLLRRAGFGSLLDLLRQGQAVTFPGLAYNPHRIDPTRADKEITIRTVGFPITNPRDEVNFVLMFEDITERTRTELSLKESEERFRKLSDAAFDGILIHEGGRIVQVNTKLADMFGYKSDEMIGRSILELVSAQHRATLDREVESGHEESIHIEAQRQDGSTFPAELVGRGSRYQGRDVQVAAVKDLSERHTAEAALRRERDFNKTLIDFSPTYFVALDWAGRIMLMNQTMLRTLGYEMDDIRGADFRDTCVHPDAHPILVDAFKRAVKDKQPTYDEYRIVSRDGREFSVQWHGQAVFKPDGEFDYFFGVGIDVTKRRRAEKQLNTERATFLSILNRVPYGIILLEADGRYVFANKAFTEMTGYTLEDVPTGREWFRQAFPEPEYRRQALEQWHHDFPAGGTSRVFTITCRDKSQKDIEFRLLVIEGQRVILTLFNVTERRRAEAALRESEARFRNLSENAPDLIATLDMEGAFTYVNPAWPKLLGHQRHEVIGRYFIEFTRPEDGREYVRIFKKVFQGKETISGYSGLLIHQDGTPRRFEMSAAPNFDSDGNVTGIIVLGADTTEQSRLEEQLRHSQKMEAVGTLAGGVSHDLNNVLHAISGYAQLLLRQKNPEDPDYRHLELMNRSVERGAELVKQLLTFSRKVEAKMRPVDLNAEIRDVCRLLERTIPRMIDIATDLQADLRPVQADPAQIEQIIMNLGANARDAMPEGGTLLFRTSSVHLEDPSTLAGLELDPGHYVKLTVQDDGLGMNLDTLEKIFEPFFTTKGFAEGTGLGLSTVYGIVKNHGGHITCQSAVNRGTIFEIYLPAWELDGVQYRGSEPQQTEILGGRETILLVDDEVPVLEIGTSVLEEYGYRTVTADCGERAVDLVQDLGEGIDLVILDLSMPGMGGRKCLHQLRELEPSLKVIIASGYSADAQVQESLESGAAAFLSKPYRLIDLVATVRQVLDRNDGD